MMNEKWTIIFKLVDFNRDGVISSKDRDDCLQSFLNTYKPEGERKERMLTQLNTFWNKIVFITNDPDWNKTFTFDEFLTTRREVYTKDSERSVAVVREGLTQLVTAVDVKASGKLSFDEFKLLHEAFNLKDDNLIKGIYSLVGADGNGDCSVSDIAEFYTELSMGENEEKHQQYKSGLASVGFL